ncbi:retrovirus-related Pol polyprotein from transposon 412 [Trichonephila clavipes]|nr:retrovirus-related Pol polyprotein from transposon 412 [Trichonephila clavipes]
MKTRLQKTGESLQEYASEVERLTNLAFSDHPATMREVILIQYFVDGLKEGEIQKAVRMEDVQDLKSALLYALKVEAANETNCRDRHFVRGARATTDAPCESPWRKEIEKLREEIQDLMAQRQNLRRRRITFWGCGGAGHLRSSCPRINKDHNIKCWGCGRTGHCNRIKVCSNRKGSADENGDVRSKRPCSESSKNLSNSLRVEKKFGVIDPVVRQVTTLSKSALDPWSDESVRKDQLADLEIKPIIKFKESSDEKPSWQDIAPFHPTTKRYWALWDSLHLRNGVLYRKWESDDRKTFRWQLILPKTKISTVLKELHDSPTGGHSDVMKNLQKVRERFYWNNVQSDVEKCCRTCDPCAARKGPRKRTRGRLQLYNVGAPFERMAFDILGPLPRSSAVHETTGYSPSQMLFGRDFRLPADLLFSRPPDASLAPEEYIEKLQAPMEEMHHLARERIGMAFDKMKTRTTQKQPNTTSMKATKCGYGIRNVAKDSPKLQTNWEGPYTVLNRLNDVVVRIQKSPHSKTKVIHYNRLAPYLGQD